MQAGKTTKEKKKCRVGGVPVSADCKHLNAMNGSNQHACRLRERRREKKSVHFLSLEDRSTPPFLISHLASIHKTVAVP